MSYLFARNGFPYPEEPSSLLTTLSFVNRKADTWGARYRVKPSRTEPWSDEMGRPAMILAVTRAMRRAAWGGLVKIEMGVGKPRSAVFLIKKTASPVEPAEPLRMYTGAIVDLTRGNERIAKAATHAKTKCPRVQCSGWVYTRYVAGTTTYSQHSNFPDGGNAVDLTVYINDKHTDGIDMDATVEVADVLVAAASAGYLELNRVIVKHTQWVYPSWEAKTYSGAYHTHVHAEARPLQTAKPVDAP